MDRTATVNFLGSFLKGIMAKTSFIPNQINAIMSIFGKLGVKVKFNITVSRRHLKFTIKQTLY